MSVYNGMPFLKEAVESVLEQTYKNFEFIIVDDASSDDTLKYLKSLKDKQSLRSSSFDELRTAGLKRIKLIENKKNLGLAASLNIALRQAQGDYIARMDADDISYPERLNTQLKYLERNKEIDLCGSWVTLINQEGKTVGKNRKNPLEDYKIKRLLGIYPAIIHPSFFGTRKFFVKSGGYKEEFDGAEDYELLCRAKNRFKYANIAKELLQMRLRDDRRSIKIMDKMYDLDIKIKKDNLKRDGLNVYGIYGLLKMVTLHYLIPLALKRKIARLLKVA